MIQIYAIIAAVFLVTVGGGGFYIKYLHNQAEIAQLENIVLATAAEKSEVVINRLVEESVDNQLAYERLNDRWNRAEEYQKELLVLLRDHDLTALATAKPGLIERRINDATEKLFKDMQSDTTE